MLDADPRVLVAAGLLLGVSSIVILLRCLRDDATEDGKRGEWLSLWPLAGTLGVLSIATLAYVLFRR